MLRGWVTAPAGTPIDTAPPNNEKDTPAAVATLPSRTSTSTDAGFPSIETVIVAVPGFTPETSPAATWTVALSELDQMASRPVSVAPDALFGKGVNSSVPPGTRTTPDAGEIVTVATGSGGAVPSPQPIPSTTIATAKIGRRFIDAIERVTGKTPWSIRRMISGLPLSSKMEDWSGRRVNLNSNRRSVHDSTVCVSPDLWSALSLLPAF